MLLERLRATIARHQMIEKGERVLVAVSGGVDSVVLLEGLHRLREELDTGLVIAHLDHGLRGAEAREDARFVEKLGKGKVIKVESDRVDVRAISRRKRIGIEQAARLARLQFLEQTAERAGTHKIALGHTLDDRVETLLHNLIRGAGPRGLQGIRPVRGQYIRPLIDTSREEVLHFAREEALSWREDRTNQELIYTRNRIRHEIIPSLKRLNPRLLAALARTAELLQEEEAALDYLLDRPWKEVLKKGERGELLLSLQGLRRFPLGLQGLLLRRAISRVRGSLEGVERCHISALHQLIGASNAHGEAHLPGLVVRRQGDELCLTTNRKERGPQYEFPLRLGRTEVPELGMAIELSLTDWDRATPLPQERDMEVADADCLRFPLQLRSRRPGDRFRPLGLRGTKKLKDFLIDERVPFYDRAELPLVCDGEKIVWVVGVRLADSVRVTQKTSRVLVMRREKLK